MPSPLDLAAELARRAATTTKTISPSEHRVVSPSPSRVVAPRRVFCDGTEQFLAQMHETQFERYWDAIAPYTFRSVMLPLGVEELKALSAAHAIAAAAAASATSTPPRHYPNSSTAESIEAQSPSRWSVTSVAATAALKRVKSKHPSCATNEGIKIPNVTGGISIRVGKTQMNIDRDTVLRTAEELIRADPASKGKKIERKAGSDRTVLVDQVVAFQQDKKEVGGTFSAPFNALELP